jgi:aminoacrylate hydrolase
VYHEIHGRTDPGAPVILLSSGLGGSAHYWVPQFEALGTHYKIIAYDQRGTGRSPDTLPEGYAVADMAAEAGALLDSLGITECDIMGHALGGLIALQLALDRPALVRRMVLVNAWAKTHPHTIRCFQARKSLLLNDGIPAYVAAQPLFLYPAWWLATRQAWLEEQDASGITHFPPVDVALRRIAAILAFDLQSEIPKITAPTLAIAARDDVLVPSTCSEQLGNLFPKGLLPNGMPWIMEAGGHACNVTLPIPFNAQVVSFLRQIPGFTVGSP